ncbi:hypothetical protein [Spiroplasma endosymbiont of 'Nebria riversi']|uniref:hypothetical protein n=1 Tax=Spiroplasma endosymbiont of 'Nebria riversi' TaxID=2792084 RepID=UPI001C03B4A6|nr:hypothetical protein [Spiroplasma endosymbiont of 'Nebria riversi']
MKNLLGLLGTITIAGSGISGIVGNAPVSEIKSKINYSQTNNLENLNRVQRNTCSNSYIEKFTNIESDIRNIAVDSKGNIFFYKSENNIPTYGSYNLYVLKQDKSTPNKINRINGEVDSMVIDNNDNVYIVASDSFYVLKQGTYTVTKMGG